MERTQIDEAREDSLKSVKYQKEPQKPPPNQTDLTHVSVSVQIKS